MTGLYSSFDGYEGENGANIWSRSDTRDEAEVLFCFNLFALRDLRDFPISSILKSLDWRKEVNVSYAKVFLYNQPIHICRTKSLSIPRNKTRSTRYSYHESLPYWRRSRSRQKFDGNFFDTFGSIA